MTNKEKAIAKIKSELENDSIGNALVQFESFKADITQHVTLKTVWQLETYGMAKLITTELKATGMYRRLLDGKKVLYILDGTTDDTVDRLQAEKRYSLEFKQRYGKTSLMSEEWQRLFKTIV